jgi:hypothetical protein
MSPRWTWPQAQEECSFFEKKNQKTFVFCCARLKGLATGWKQFFASFFQKRSACLSSPGTTSSIPTTRLTLFWTETGKRSTLPRAAGTGKIVAPIVGGWNAIRCPEAGA